jgi:hypothetical protein
MYYKFAVFKSWDDGKENNISKWNTIERSEIELQAKRQLTSDKSTMIVQWEKNSLSDGAEGAR